LLRNRTYPPLLPKGLSSREVLHIYAMNTAPAFEAALFAGIRLAGPAQQYRQPIARYARHLGVAFQILNDLGDGQIDEGNKRAAGGDVFNRRPTILLALALEGLDPAGREELLALVDGPEANGRALEHVDRLYRHSGAYDNARTLVDKHHQRAREVADGLQPEALRHLLHYLADNLLE
jgi:geranylgeranyl diphosphate synthase, type II